MTLAGRSVAVCRAAHQAAPLLDRLTQAGATPVHVPLIEVVPPTDDGAELHRLVSAADATTWLTFTSANGVDAVARVLEGAAPAGRVAVVGGATAESVTAHGWEISWVAPIGTGAALGASLPVEAGERVLAPLAELASDDLVDALAERDIVVETVTAYRTVTPDISPADRDRIAQSDVVLVTAPSVISRLVSVMGDRALPPLVAIGPTSAAAIVELGLTVADVADEPGVDGLIAAAVRTLLP